MNLTKWSAGKFIKVPFYVTYAVMMHQPYTDLMTTRNCVAKKIKTFTSVPFVAKSLTIY